MTEEVQPVALNVRFEFDMIYYQVLQELSDRVEVEMSERDSLAVMTALRKALFRSAWVLVHRVNEIYFELNPDALVKQPPAYEPEEDLWADRYGTEDQT